MNPEQIQILKDLVPTDEDVLNFISNFDGLFYLRTRHNLTPELENLTKKCVSQIKGIVYCMLPISENNGFILVSYTGTLPCSTKYNYYVLCFAAELIHEIRVLPC